MTERPLRVLQLVDMLTPRLGGGERTALRLATDLAGRGLETWVATTRVADGWPLDALSEAGVRHVRAERTSRLDMRSFAPLWQTLRDERVDILHAHLHGSNVWGALFARLAGTPVMIAHEHSWSFQGDQARRVIDGTIGRVADAFVAVSEADATLMHSYEKVPASKIHVIPSAWEPRPAGDGSMRVELGIPAAAPVLGTIAVFRRVKRLELLVEAFSRVLVEVPDAWLLIVGDGPDRPAVEAAIERFAVGHRTRLTGTREDVGAAWRAIDVAAMSSDREGVPVAVLEALAQGVPVVAPAVGGIPEVLTAGGVLVPPGEVGALSGEIVRLMGDPALRAEIGGGGRARAEDFTAARQVERCTTLYRTLMASPKAQRRRARLEGRR